MWLGRESNPRHEDFQSSALPTELPSRERVRILSLITAASISVKNPGDRGEETCLITKNQSPLRMSWKTSVLSRKPVSSSEPGPALTAMASSAVPTADAVGNADGSVWEIPSGVVV